MLPTDNSVKCIHIKDATPIPKQENLSDFLELLSENFEKTVDLIETTPNDQELGAKIREQYKPFLILKQVVKNQINAHG